jgi:hypothetical protein
MSSEDHFLKFKEKILNQEPFALIRPADGEYYVCNNIPLTNIDNWTFSRNSCLRDDLVNAIQNCNDVHVGIPCRDCSPEIYEWYRTNFNIQNLTYANIFCNKNWNPFIELFTNRNLPFYYIGPYVSNPLNLNMIDKFRTDEFLVNNWDRENYTFTNSLKEWIKDKKGLFLFSIGPISKVIIPMLWKEDPTNTYLDIGSTFDLFMKGTTNREYANPHSSYANLVCDFKYGHKQPEVTAILTLYKRPYCLEKQIEAIRNQTIPPKQIILLKNYFEGVSLPELKNITVIDCNKNFGVWARFAASLLADTEFVCVFDDDTIPGKRWFENCISSMKKREGLYGTIGVIFPQPSYSITLDNRVGWDRPNTEITEVDIVGHSWFFKREWVTHLWRYNPNYKDDLKCGEDINFSFQLQKIGIPTLVPPHPPGEHELYGSNPTTGWQYGADNNAVSREVTSSVLFDNALQNAIRKGFKLLCMNR